MEERRSLGQAGDANGACRCDDWKQAEPTGENESIRKLLRDLEAELEGLEPTEATKKFGEDLKEADKEYLSLGGVITKYREFYNKLDVRLAEARSWKQDIKQGCEEVDEATRRAIKELRVTRYDEVEKTRCCEWLRLRAELIKLGDCLSQAVKKEEQAADDYKAYKEFEKNLTAKFAELAALWKQATGLIEEERFKAVCAMYAEFRDVYYDLGTVRTWKRALEECRGGYQPPGNQGEPDLKKQWHPDKLKERLTKALRKLILAKYQRFRWQNNLLGAEADNKKAKESCEKFRKARRDEFIQEAEDVEAQQQAGQAGQAEQPASA